MTRTSSPISLAALPIARLANSNAQRWVRSHRGAMPRSLGEPAAGALFARCATVRIVRSDDC
jgi:hypothetical protein